MKLRNTLIGSTLLVAAFGSSALSLGRARGAVVLGQPLDLAVDVRLDSSDDAGSGCFEADVFHGEGQVAPNRVRVIVVAGTQGQDAVVRIRSSAVVDEPVVGVVLRSICSQKASHRYDFLTDFPVETRAAAVPTIIPATVTAQRPAPPPSVDTPMVAATPAPVAAPRPAPIRSAPRPAPVVRAPRPAPVPKPVVAKEIKEPVAAPKLVAPKVETKAEAPNNKPRLKLESPQTPDDRLVQLKPASDLVLTPTNDPQKREAAAVAWRELNNLPVENLQEKQRLLTLEAEAKTLKALLAKNEADFKLRLDKLENTRSDSSLVYSLIGLLLAAIAAAAFFWNRSRQRAQTPSTDWSHHGEPSAEELGRASFLSRPASLTASLPPNTLPGSNQDVDESLFDDLKKLTAVTTVAKPLVLAPRANLTPVRARSINPDEFLDVQQHADFYVSLGQYDQAIDVLKKTIYGAEAHPLAYLELLKIYHTLGRQPEYKLQRNAFSSVFNCQVPEFSEFTQEGQTLEGYPAVMRSIESQWGTPQVLDFIEACLFVDSSTSANKPFDLAAYRELLLLYAMAQHTVRQTDGLSSQQAMSKVRAGRASRPKDLELDLVKPAPFDASIPRETSFTQPMLLASEMVLLEAQDTDPEPLASAYRPPLDLDLDLNLDFSNSELTAMQELSAMPTIATIAAVPAVPAVPAVMERVPAPLDLDLDLDLDLAASAPLPAAPMLPAIDDNMLEFDLFDPEIEAKIAPKKA